MRSLTERLLRASLVGAVSFAVVAVVWGWLADSRLILFDGLFSLVGVALSGLSLLAFRAVERGPDAAYPYGREVLGSLVLIVKGVAIAVLCVGAIAGAVLDLLAGGRDVALTSALVYAVAATLACATMGLILTRGQRRQTQASGLLRAEAAEWWLDTLLSLAVLVGFLAGFGLARAGFTDAARYTDPVMVALLATVFLILPLRLLREGARGVLAAAPDDEVLAAVEEVVAAVGRQAGAAATDVTLAAFGERLDTTVTVRFDPDRHLPTLPELDLLRAELDRRLAMLPYPLLVTVTATADLQGPAEPHRLRAP